MLDITQYHVTAPQLRRVYRLALVTDLHNCRYQKLLRAIGTQKPDAIVIAGDLMGKKEKLQGRALEFLREAVKSYPVFYGLGNHEHRLRENMHRVIRETGATLLVNEAVRFEELLIGGIRPDLPGQKEELTEEHRAFVSRFARMTGYRVLLCHRPEWYFFGIRDFDIPVVLSGHAHGGQVRLFGHPVYSPGQGLFPKYAQGMHEGRLIVSRGLGNHTVVPRFFNAPELCILTIGGEVPSDKS